LGIDNNKKENIAVGKCSIFKTVYYCMYYIHDNKAYKLTFTSVIWDVYTAVWIFNIALN